MPATARTTDPWTSHEAARSISEVELRESQLAVLYVLRRYGKKGMTDPQLIELYQDVRRSDGLPRQSESGIRTRRSELQRKRLVRECGSTRLETGRRAIIWKAVA